MRRVREPTDSDVESRSWSRKPEKPRGGPAGTGQSRTRAKSQKARMPKMRDDLTTTDAFAILCSEGGVDTTPFADSASRTTAGCVRLNSSGRRTDGEWFNEMGFEDCLKLSRKMTVARMLERDDFAKRYASKAPISIIEFLYPLIQGYDSLVLNADVEIGGTDQLFNMLVGRTLQKDAGKQEQAVITMPLLVGLDGTKKMSKSADNYIAFTDSSKEMFGKIMSISDDTMWDYYRLLLELSEEKIEKLKTGHPMEAKKHLASSLVGQFHSMQAAKHELEQFEQVFSKNKLPDDMPTFTWNDLVGDAASAPLFELMAQSELFESKGAIRRLVQQGGVKVDGEKQDDPNREITPPTSDQIFQAGKRVFFKVVG